jgi:hypothetical protein
METAQQIELEQMMPQSASYFTLKWCDISTDLARITMETHA